MKYKSIAEIQNLQLDQCFPEVISRLVDISSVPVGVLFYELSANQELSLYERIILHESLAKPPEEAVNAEFVTYKQELLDNFDQKKSILDRYEALPEFRKLMDYIGRSDANLKVLKLEMVESMDLILIQQLEDAIPAVIPAKQAEDAIKEKIEVGRKAKAACDDCLHLVRGFNKESGMTKQEIKQMKVDFADILDDLKDGMPVEAKALIVAVDNPAFNDLRDALIAVLGMHGY